MALTSSTSSIVAQAFTYLQMGRPTSFDDDDAQAIDANRAYPEAIRICLEACDWSFASAVVHPPLMSELPPGMIADDDLPFAFTVPGDCITLQEVGDAFTQWRLDRKVLRADQDAPLRLRYTQMLDSEQFMPATFRDAVALRMACLLAARWLTTESKIQDLEARADQTLKEAMRRDGRTASAARADDLSAASDWVSEALR